jgi:hypothetical protein
MAWIQVNRDVCTYTCPHTARTEQGLSLETGSTSQNEQTIRSTYNVVEAWPPAQRGIAWSLS